MVYIELIKIIRFDNILCVHFFNVLTFNFTLNSKFSATYLFLEPLKRKKNSAWRVSASATPKVCHSGTRFILSGRQLRKSRLRTNFLTPSLPWGRRGSSHLQTTGSWETWHLKNQYLALVTVLAFAFFPHFATLGLIKALQLYCSLLRSFENPALSSPQWLSTKCSSKSGLHMLIGLFSSC